MLKMIKIAVCGAHMSGLALNHQLTALDAHLCTKTFTAKGYRLFNVPKKVPPRPGMVRDVSCDTAIEIEVWEMPQKNFGDFLVQIASPLCIGTILLEDGSNVYGFLCESYVLTDAQEITKYGGWRAFI